MAGQDGPPGVGRPIPDPRMGDPPKYAICPTPLFHVLLNVSIKIEDFSEIRSYHGRDPTKTRFSLKCQIRRRDASKIATEQRAIATEKFEMTPEKREKNTDNWIWKIENIHLRR